MFEFKVILACLPHILSLRREGTKASPASRPQTYIVQRNCFTAAGGDLVRSQKMALLCWRPFFFPKTKTKRSKGAPPRGSHKLFEQTAHIVFQRVLCTTNWGDLARSQKIALLCWCPFCLPQNRDKTIKRGTTKQTGRPLR